MIIADTGFFLALFNASDTHHRRAVTILNNLTESLVTTHPVVTETCYLLMTRGGGIHQERQFLRLSRTCGDKLDLFKKAS